MRSSVEVGLVCALLGLAPCLSAQGRAVGHAGVDSALAALVVRLRADPQVGPTFATEEADSTNAFEDLMGSLSFARLSDSATLQVLPLLNETMADLPQDSCGAMFSAPHAIAGAGFVELLSKVDQTTLQHWLEVFESVILSNARGDPEQPKASHADSQAIMVRMIQSMEPADKERLIAGLDAASTPPSEQCWAYQRLFTEVSALPVQDQLLVVRAAFP